MMARRGPDSFTRQAAVVVCVSLVRVSAGRTSRFVASVRRNNKRRRVNDRGWLCVLLDSPGSRYLQLSVSQGKLSASETEA